MNRELIEILRELEKKRIPKICGYISCRGVGCTNCFMHGARFTGTAYIKPIFSISL